MSDQINASCQTCRYSTMRGWRPAGGGAMDAVVECRRYPPAPQRNGGRGRFPEIEMTDYCGEWTAAGEMENA